jgi:hypothetical protein
LWHFLILCKDGVGISEYARVLGGLVIASKGKFRNGGKSILEEKKTEIELYEGVHTIFLYLHADCSGRNHVYTQVVESTVACVRRLQEGDSCICRLQWE